MPDPRPAPRHRRTVRAAAAGGAAAAILILAGCAASATPAGSPAARGEREAALTDGTIGGLFIATNNAIIGSAGIAIAKGLSPDVRQFGQTMTNDHTALNTAITDILARHGIVPIDNETSLTLRDDAEQLRDVMQDRDGREFDRFYIDNEIAYHTRLLERMDRQLIPDAVTPELRQFLTNARGAIAAHLAHGRVVRKGL